MKAIVDIGTNIYNSQSCELLLPFFLDHYESLGVNKFIIHGNEKLIDVVNQKCHNYDVVFVPITRKQFDEYKQKDCDNAKKIFIDPLLAKKYFQQPCSDFICPLWILQNELKKTYVGINELCFILDLDEFVDMSKLDLKIIEDNAHDLAYGSIVDMFALNGKIIELQPNVSIYEQLPVKTKLTSFGNRATNKLILTRGHIEHCHGHHDTYIKNSYQKKSSYHKNIDVMHMKFFKQNMEHLYNGEHNIELQFIDNHVVKPEIWRKIICSEGEK